MRGGRLGLLPLIDSIEELVFGNLALSLLISESFLGLEELLIQDLGQRLLLKKLLLQLCTLLGVFWGSWGLLSLLRQSLILLCKLGNLGILTHKSLLVGNQLLVLGKYDLLELLQVLMNQNIQGGMLLVARWSGEAWGWWHLEDVGWWSREGEGVRDYSRVEEWQLGELKDWLSRTMGRLLLLLLLLLLNWVRRRWRGRLGFLLLKISLIFRGIRDWLRWRWCLNLKFLLQLLSRLSLGTINRLSRLLLLFFLFLILLFLPLLLLLVLFMRSLILILPIDAFNFGILSFLLLWSVSNLLSRLLIFYRCNSLNGDCYLNLSFLLLFLFFEASLFFDLLPFSFSLLLLLADFLGLSLLKELLNAVLFSTFLIFLFLDLAAESLSRLGA
jgi:hypothetical protein